MMMFVPSPQAQDLLDELRDGLAVRLSEDDDAKAVYEEAMAEFPAAEGTELERGELGGVPSLRVVAPGAGEEPGILYLHGGGFSVGSASSNQDLLARLGHGAGATAIGIDYPLLPDARFPVALEAALAAYRELVAGGPAAGPRRQLSRRRTRTVGRDDPPRRRRGAAAGPPLPLPLVRPDGLGSRRSKRSPTATGWAARRW